MPSHDTKCAKTNNIRTVEGTAHTAAGNDSSTQHAQTRDKVKQGNHKKKRRGMDKGKRGREGIRTRRVW